MQAATALGGPVSASGTSTIEALTQTRKIEEKHLFRCRWREEEQLEDECGRLPWYSGLTVHAAANLRMRA